MLFNKIIFKNKIFSQKKRENSFVGSTTIGKDIHFIGSQYKAFIELGHLAYNNDVVLICFLYVTKVGC